MTLSEEQRAELEANLGLEFTDVIGKLLDKYKELYSDSYDSPCPDMDVYLDLFMMEGLIRNGWPIKQELFHYKIRVPHMWDKKDEVAKE